MNKSRLIFGRLLLAMVSISIVSGCSNKAGNGGSATSGAVDIDKIVKQVELSHQFQTEDLEAFQKETMDQNMAFLVERDKQEQLASHLMSNLDAIKAHVELVNAGQTNNMRFGSLSKEERLEVAKLAEKMFGEQDKADRTKSHNTALEKAKKIDEEREAKSSARYKEKGELKAKKNAEQTDFLEAFKPMVKDKGPAGLDEFTINEKVGMFSDSQVDFRYKNEQDQLIRLNIAVRLEATNYTNQESMKKKEHYLVLVDSKTQLVLETGRLFINLKTNADLEEGKLWEFFQGVTDAEEMKRLVDEFQ